MNLCVLRYAQYDKVKPIYHLAEGDKFLLTAKISPDSPTVFGTPGIFKLNGQIPKKISDREEGLYFIGVVMRNKPMWSYTYENYHKKGYNYYEIDYSSEFLNKKESGVIENKILYKSMREEQLKNYIVLCE